jgi:hypothetical protein
MRFLLVGQNELLLNEIAVSLASPAHSHFPAPRLALTSTPRLIGFA